MPVTKAWSDNDTVGAVLFEDGHRLAYDEKAAVLIKPDGTFANRWWKEEPAGEHYNEFLNGPRPTEEPITEELSQAIFEAGHASWGVSDEERDAIFKKLASLLI